MYTELLRKLYDYYCIYGDQVSKADLYDRAFEYLQLTCKIQLNNNVNAILFMENGTICYRKVFNISDNRVKNDWGLDLSILDVIPYEDNPKQLKEVLMVFIKKLLNGEIDDSFFCDTIKHKKESKMNTVLDKMLDANKESAVRSAKVEMGKAANKLVLEKVTPQLPMMVRGYADSPLAELIVGNVVAGLLIQFAPGNEKAQVLSDAMIAAGVQVALETFDIPGLVSDLLENVDMPTFKD
ncbi:MAG: hypothetical protein GY707_05445 [Desulfobacteraceae bacterium]|nr:hypothetical protein [Desulfobacteraceae bacterium]